MAPYPKITSVPPLGQLSIIPPEQEELFFSVIIEWNRARPNYPFELCLCYTNSAAAEHASRWEILPLEPRSILPALIGRHEDAFRSVFTGNIDLMNLYNSAETDSRHLTFTIKYRVNSYAPWQWVQVQQGISPGELLIQKHIDDGDSFPQLLQLESDWKVSESVTQTQSAHVFTFESLAIIPKEKAGEELEMKTLGTIHELLRFLAIVRLEPYWLGPRHGEDFFYLAEDAIACCFLTKDGQILTLVAFNGAEDIYTVLRSNQKGQIVVAARNSGGNDASFRILLAVAPSIESSLAAAMAEARNTVNESLFRQKLADQMTGMPDTPSHASTSPDEWLDGLTYCTWNGIGQDLSDAKILTALENLAENDIKITTLLIDDNWQTLGKTDDDYSEPFYRGWSRFEANEEGFPLGLKNLLTRIRQEHPNIQDIGVWHAFFGYWAGIANDGQIARDYKTVKVQAKLMGNVPCSINSIEASDLHRMYDDFYAWLSSCGITFVKTDVQHMLAELATNADRAALTSAYQLAWISAHRRHFSAKAISCMSQIPQTLFHSLLQNLSPRIVLRNSDDFYPEIPASHPWHLWANAHNSLFTQHLNVVPDWDMFQTSHEYSAYHAAARCLSGGPIAITDIPGEHDVGLIEQMVATSPNGRTMILRPNVAKTINFFDSYTAGCVLKIGTLTGPTASDTSLLGLCNVSEQQTTFMLPLTEFPGFRLTSIRGYKVIVRSHLTSEVCGPFNLDSDGMKSQPNQLLYIKMLVRGYDILSTHRVDTIQLGSSEWSICILGLLGKMTGAAAVVSTSFGAKDGKAHVSVSLKALGKLGIWISGSVKGEYSVTLLGKLMPKDKYKVSTQPNGLENAQLLEIDALSVWNDWNLWKDGHKEIDVEVLIA